MNRSDAELLVDSGGMVIKEYISLGRDSGLWDEMDLVFKVSTCLWSYLVTDVEMYQSLSEKGKLRIKKRKVKSLLKNEGWTEKEIKFCLFED